MYTGKYRVPGSMAVSWDGFRGQTAFYSFMGHVGAVGEIGISVASICPNINTIASSSFPSGLSCAT